MHITTLLLFHSMIFLKLIDATVKIKRSNILLILSLFFTTLISNSMINIAESGNICLRIRREIDEQGEYGEKYAEYNISNALLEPCCIAINCRDHN
jgi:hypothetical protein